MVATALMLAMTGCGSQEIVGEAMQNVSRMEYEAALELFEQAKEAGESSRQILRGQGIAYLGMAQYDQAIECLEQCLGESDGSVEDLDYDVNYYLAAAYCKKNEYEKAREIYDSILALRPKEKNAYFYRGSVEMELGDYQGAVEDFEQVISMEPGNYDRIIAIYQIMAEKGHKETGKGYLEEALAYGESKMSPYDSGRIYFFLEDYQKAYIALEEAKSNGGAESYLYLGKAYEATGDFNYATSVYSNYLSKEGPDAAIYNQLGTCEMKKKDYRKALEAFQAGLEIGDPSFHQSLAFNEIVAYEYLGEFKRASALLQEYLKKYPEDLAAKREQQFLSTR